MEPDDSISVVMPTYNRASYIGEALDSLMRQTRPPSEVIVVDDASTDDTRARVEGHPFAAKIRYHFQRENKGAAVARNLGVDIARSKWIALLDSDDRLETDHHATAVRILREHPDVTLFGCDSHLIGPRGEACAERTWTSIQCDIKGYRISSGRRSLADIFLFSTPCPGLVVRRSVWCAVGGLDQSLFPLEDYDLQMKVAAAGGGVYYEHQPLARYRIHPSNASGAASAVRVCEQKLRCIELALERYGDLRALGVGGRRRRGEVRRELAIALMKRGRVAAGLSSLLRSLLEDPRGFRDLSRIGARRIGRV